MIKKYHSISLIDMSVMHNVFGNNHAAILEFLESFVALTSSMLKKADHAIQEKNDTVAMACFHQMKGPVGSIGFKKMYLLCEKTEEKITQADWASANQLCDDMEKILNKLAIELQKIK